MGADKVRLAVVLYEHRHGQDVLLIGVCPRHDDVAALDLAEAAMRREYGNKSVDRNIEEYGGFTLVAVLSDGCVIEATGNETMLLRLEASSRKEA